MILGSLVIFGVVFAAVVLAAAWAMRTTVDRLVHRRHEELEEILDTEDIPRAWRAGQSRPEQCLRKLDRLRRYVETTRLVDGEETRQVLLDRLAAVRSSVRDSRS